MSPLSCHDKTVTGYWKRWFVCTCTVNTRKKIEYLRRIAINNAIHILIDISGSRVPHLEVL